MKKQDLEHHFHKALTSVKKSRTSSTYGTMKGDDSSSQEKIGRLKSIFPQGFEREGQRLIEDFERALKAEKAKNIREKRIPERELRSTIHIEPLYQRSIATSPRDAILQQLGDTDYTYRFKVRNYNTPVTILQYIPKVYKSVASKLSSNWPQNREEHQQRSDFWLGATIRLRAEAERLYKIGETYFGGSLSTHGAPLSGGAYPHWSKELKDRIHFAVHGLHAAEDAVQLHQTILKQRSLK